jgi:hypothetical protein
MKNFTAQNTETSPQSRGKTSTQKHILQHFYDLCGGGCYRSVTLIAIFFVAVLPKLTLAQLGTICSSPYSIGRMPVVSLIQSTTDTWINFKAKGNTTTCNFISLDTIRIDSIIIYQGNCMNKIRITSQSVPSTGNFGFNFSTIKDTNYIIQCYRNMSFCGTCNQTANYQIGIQNYNATMMGGSNACNPNIPGWTQNDCELICNPSFEFQSSAPSNASELTKAYNWDDLYIPPNVLPCSQSFLRTPDYFSSSYNIPPPLPAGNFNVDVPANSFGDIGAQNHPHGNNSYVGIIAAGKGENTNETTSSYQEYIQGSLREPLIPGLTYQFSVDVSLACVSEMKVTKLQAYFTNGDIVNQPPTIINIPCNYGAFTIPSGQQPHIVFTPQNTIGQWETFNGTFTPTNSFDHISFGLFETGVINDNMIYVTSSEYPASCDATTGQPLVNADEISSGANPNQANWAYYYIDNFQVKPNNPVTNENIQICTPGLVTLTAPAGITNVVWQPGNLSGNTVQVYVNTSTQFTYTGTINSNCGVNGIANVVVDNLFCCVPQSNGDILYSISGLLTPYSASTLIAMNGSNVIQPIGLQNKLLITGQFIVDEDLIFDNGLDVIMGDDAKIYVNPGVKFIVTGASDIRACDKMWDGITLYGNALGAPSYFYLNDYSTVQDAKVALLTDDNFSIPLTPWGTFTIGGGIYYIEGNAILNKNHTNILVRDWDNFPGYIKNSEIKCRASNLTQPNDHLLEVILNTAFLTNRTYSGVQTINVNTIDVGDATDGSNIFDNMDVGIFTLNTHSKIQNNEFKDFNQHPNYFPNFNQFCPCMVGTAICLRAKLATQGAKPFTTSIGGNGANEGNQIHEVNFGIDIEYHVAKIQHNSFNNIYYPLAPTFSYMGILINRVPKTFLPHYIENNTMRNVQDYFIFMRNNYNQKVIDNNLMNTNMPLSDLFWMNREATGVTVVENSNLTTLPQELFVRNNQINFVKNGVRCNNVNGMTIGENYISLLAANWNVEDPSASYGTGIKAELCLHDTIHNNTIVAQDNRNWYVEGIWLMDTKDNRINCNAMSRTASGMRFEGFNTFHVSDPWNTDDNYIIRNRMHQNWHGLWVNNGLIGHQKTVDADGNIKANDNFWTGTYSWNYHTFWSVSGVAPPPAYVGNNSKLWTRNLNSMYCPSPFLANAAPFLLPEVIEPANNNIEATPNGDHVNQACTNIDNTDLNSDIPFPGWALLLAGGGNGPSPEGAAQYWQSTNYYKLLLENPALITNTTIQAFKDSMDNAPFGQLELVLKQLGDTNLNESTEVQQIKQLNSSIAENNDLEQHFKTVNTMLIKLRELEFNDSIPVDSNLIAEIRTIALLCPSIYGPAVYHARGLMEFLDRKGYNYINDCEIQYPEDNANARSSNGEAYGANNEPAPLEEIEEVAGTENALFSFYPNPASKQLFVNMPEVNTAKYFEIFNTTGALVSCGNLNNVNGLNTLDIKQLADGLYLLKINGYKGQSFIVKQ